jgi:MFS family permease
MMAASLTPPQNTGWVETQVPGRMDRLPWSGWHWLIVTELGITWILIGRLFDTVGRKPMIVITYGASGILLAISGWLFQLGMLSANQQSILWMLIFFIASAAASSAYLTVSEIFPLEIRALAISIFYAFGTLIGGVAAPSLFGWIIGTGSRTFLFAGYLLGALLMIAAAIVEACIGVKAERQSLESIAKPLSAR